MMKPRERSWWMLEITAARERPVERRSSLRVVLPLDKQARTAVRETGGRAMAIKAPVP